MVNHANVTSSVSVVSQKQGVFNWRRHWACKSVTQFHLPHPLHIQESTLWKINYAEFICKYKLSFYMLIYFILQPLLLVFLTSHLWLTKATKHPARKSIKFAYNTESGCNKAAAAALRSKSCWGNKRRLLGLQQSSRRLYQKRDLVIRLASGCLSQNFRLQDFCCMTFSVAPRVLWLALPVFCFYCNKEQCVCFLRRCDARDWVVNLIKIG